MKQIIRLTESDLMRIIKSSVKRALNEDVLGNDWNVNDEVRNNYEAFDDVDDYEFDPESHHDWSIVGQDDPTVYEDDDYEFIDPDLDKDYDDHDLTDNELYNYGNW